MLHKNLKKFVAMVSGTFMMAHARLICLASSGITEELGGEGTAEGNPFDLEFLENPPADGGIFAEPIAFVKELSASLYGLIAIISAVICVLCLIVAGFKFMRGGRHKDEAMDQLMGILIGGGLIFGAVSLVSCFITIVRG